jgi:ribonuclease BN (tRNA processing enzyme)
MVDGAYAISVIDGSTIDVGPFRVDMTRTNHPIECYGLRLSAGDKVLTYSADTGDCPDLIALAHGSDLFLCEASYDDADVNPPGVHLTGGEAGEHATKAEVGRLILTHHVPWNDMDRMCTAASTTFAGPLEPARALEKYAI